MFGVQVKMVQHVYSNLFGTFLWNTIQERTTHRIAERSHSLWAFLLEKSTDFYNYLYEFSEESLWPSYQVRDLHFWSAVYLADLGSTGCTVDGCHGNPSTATAANTSNDSPCSSSGYATPQQTALTDSMVDTLAWKNLNIKDGPVHNIQSRNPMEDSTDTIVDDGTKSTAILRLDEAEDLEETVENFPLLEPLSSPGLSYRPDAKVVRTIVPTYQKPKGNGLSHRDDPIPMETFICEEGENVDEVDNRFNGDCQTCQKNWDLLNRNQGSLHRVPSDPMTNGHSLSVAAPASVARQGLLSVNSSGGGGGSSSNSPCLNFDLDGLLPCIDRQQMRLRSILAYKEVRFRFTKFSLLILKLPKIFVDGN